MAETGGNNVKSRMLQYLGFSLVTLVYSIIIFASTAAASGAGAASPNSIDASAPKTASPSYNWSGYVASGQTFKHIQGTIAVPTVTCTVPNAQTLIWVGFDGYNASANQTVEQDGIGAKCSATKHVTYFAWWEMFQTTQGTSLQTISSKLMTVKPGEKIRASVTYNTTYRDYVLQLDNLSTKQLFTTTRSCIGNVCGRQSAEWITERYMLGANAYTALARWNSDPAMFTESSAYTMTSKSYPINHYSYTPVNMVSQKTFANLDVTNPLYDSGTAFSVTWKAAQ
jgi:hypothetical protein